MKKINKIMVVMTIILSLLIATPANKLNAQFSASINLQTFYTELAPYGQWIDDPEFGYIWLPDAGPSFRPYYSRGHWVMTGYGSMWVSDYSWGWAPFHYGRWAYSSYYGWVWVPDTVWGPAWVSWRSGADYYGWAPLGPGISISISFGRSYSVPYDWWVFVPERYVLSNSFYNYRIAPERNVTYVNNTTIINNTYVNNNITYAAGPRVTDVERVTRSKVPVYSVASVSSPGKTSVQGNSVKVYSPQVTKSGSSKPPSVVTRDQFVKTKGQGNTSKQQNTNASERTQQVNQPAQQQKRQIEQKNTKQAPERIQQQPRQQQEQRQIPQQKQERQIEQKQIPQQKNDRQVVPERSQPQQQEQRQIPQQNKQERQVEQKQNPPQNNRQAEQSQQPQQQKQAPQQQNPANNGKSKKDN